jgi:fermentation-respiration switch protein FrsA (DUF1100 family)
MRRGSYWGRLLLFACAIGLGGLLAGAVIMVREATIKLAHPPRSLHTPDDTPARLGIAYQDVVLTARHGLKLAAWYTPPQNGRLVLVAHGYAGKRSADMVALFARHGYGVLAWDMRAHGESQGALCTFGYAEAGDVEAALDFALSQPGVRHVVAWGESVGGVATILAGARRPEIEALVVDSAFTSLDDMLALHTPSSLLQPLIGFILEQETGASLQAVRPVDQIRRLQPRPVFIIQGRADQSIPADAGRRLYAAAGEPRVLWEEDGVGHTEMVTARPAEYERRVVAFFEAALGGR